jgi:predicted dehydrogenase
MRAVDRPSVLVIGAGSIGLRHLRNLRQLGVSRLAACDVSPERLANLRVELGVETFENSSWALKTFAPDAVFVCTPPVYHIANALDAVRVDAHVFIEKPVSVRPQGIDALVEEAGSRDRIVQVGYNLRFHPGLIRIKQMIEDQSLGRILWVDAEFGQYLPDWRPGTDYRRAYTARSELGGGILLDLSHEIDYLMWLCGAIEDVTCLSGRLSDLQVDVEDTAKMLVRFENGTIGHIHLDFVQHGYTRRCKVVGSEGTVELDLASGTMRFTRPGKADTTSELDYEIQHSYVDEVRHFLELVSRGERDLTSLTSSQSTLEVVMAAYRSAGIERCYDETVTQRLAASA